MQYRHLSRAVSSAVGHAAVLATAIVGVALWMAVGLWSGLPIEWYLITNLIGTVGVFLFLLTVQHSRQLHMRSIHAKLDELIHTSEGENSLIGSERLADEMLDALRTRHRELAQKNRD